MAANGSKSGSPQLSHGNYGHLLESIQSCWNTHGTCVSQLPQINLAHHPLDFTAIAAVYGLADGCSSCSSPQQMWHFIGFDPPQTMNFTDPPRNPSSAYSHACRLSPWQNSRKAWQGPGGAIGRQQAILSRAFMLWPRKDASGLCFANRLDQTYVLLTRRK